MRGDDYAAGSKLVNSDLSFDAFLAAMESGVVVINVHTGRFDQGEISGEAKAGG